VDECMDKAVELAKHRYGCRILCRIAEHCLSEDKAMSLIGHVLEDDVTLAALCCHYFGHHALQSIMEKGSLDHRMKIVRVLCNNLVGMAKSRHASYLIEATFDFCGEDEKVTLKEKLLRDGNIIELAKHQFGGFVVKKLAGRMESEAGEGQDDDAAEGGTDAFTIATQREVRKMLREHDTELINDKNGKKLLDEIFQSMTTRPMGPL